MVILSTTLRKTLGDRHHVASVKVLKSPAKAHLILSSIAEE